MNDFADSEELFEQKKISKKPPQLGLMWRFSFGDQGAKLALVFAWFASTFVIATTVRVRISRIAAF